MGLGAVALVAFGVAKKVVLGLDSFLEFPEDDIEKDNVLFDVVVDVGRVDDFVLDFGVVDEDLVRVLEESSALAEKILAEAKALAGQRMRERFSVV